MRLLHQLLPSWARPPCRRTPPHARRPRCLELEPLEARTLLTGWYHADLTDITGAPAAGDYSPLSGYAWEASNSKQDVYLTPDGHVHELSVTASTPWYHADLTAFTGAPPAVFSGSPLRGFARLSSND